MFPILTTVPVRFTAVVTWLLIALNALVFFLELDLTKGQLQQLVYLFGIVPARFTHPDWARQVGFPVGAYWPLATSMFLHGGWLHIVGNMWTLWLFGRNVEDQMGSVRFLIFYLVCGVGSAVVHVLINANSTVPAIGASGAIAGVMGAYLAMFPTSRVVVMIPILFYPLFFDFPAVFYLGYWFLLQLFSGTMSLAARSHSVDIAFWAHVGGFLVGLSVYALFLRPRDERRPPQPDEGDLHHAWNQA